MHPLGASRRRACATPARHTFLVQSGHDALERHAAAAAQCGLHNASRVGHGESPRRPERSAAASRPPWAAGTSAVRRHNVSKRITTWRLAATSGGVARRASLSVLLASGSRSVSLKAAAPFKCSSASARPSSEETCGSRRRVYRHRGSGRRGDGANAGEATPTRTRAEGASPRAFLPRVPLASPHIRRCND